MPDAAPAFDAETADAARLCCQGDGDDGDDPLALVAGRYVAGPDDGPQQDRVVVVYYDDADEDTGVLDTRADRVDCVQAVFEDEVRSRVLDGLDADAQEVPADA